MTSHQTFMSSLELQDVTNQLVQQFMAELQDMLDDLIAGELSPQQSNVLSKVISFFDNEMKQHHLEEEGHIFPLLLSRGDALMSEKVQTLKADHEALRSGWRDLKSAIEQMAASPGTDGLNLYACFDRYSDCFARHLALEESVQFSPETRELFKSWDS